MATASSSKTNTTDKETPQENGVWMELRLLQLTVIQTRLGQAMLKLMDNFLWVVEKCAEWSLPRQKIGEDENRKESGKPELVRPLPWILFLPSLIFLRVIRIMVNIGISVLGYSTITPSGMVKFVQVCRRYLNVAINKDTRERYVIKDKRPSLNEAKKVLINSIRLTLSSLACLDTSKSSFSPPPTKIHVSSILNPDPIILEEKLKTGSMDSAKILNNSNDSSESEEETIKEEIDRLALENSEDDEDYDPVKCCLSNSTSSSDDEKSVESTVSLTEVKDIIADEFQSKSMLEFLDAERTFQQEFVEKKSSVTESRDKVEELATSQRIDSPECCTSDRSSQEGDPIFYSAISSDSDTSKDFPITQQCTSREILKTNEFINGEVRFIPTSSISEAKSSGETDNGAVVQKRGTNMNKGHKGKRTSHGNRKKK